MGACLLYTRPRRRRGSARSWTPGAEEEKQKEGEEDEEVGVATKWRRVWRFAVASTSTTAAAAVKTKKSPILHSNATVSHSAQPHGHLTFAMRTVVALDAEAPRWRRRGAAVPNASRRVYRLSEAFVCDVDGT